MDDWVNITARQLRAGDKLWPSGDEILSVQCFAEKVEVTLKEVHKPKRTYNLDPAWPLRRLS